MPDIKLGHKILKEMIKKMEKMGEGEAIDFYNSLNEHQKESVKIAIKDTADSLTAVFDSMAAELRKLSSRIELLGDALFQIEQSEENEDDIVG